MSEESKKLIPSNICSTSIRILGIPVFSITRNIEIDEDVLYEKMSSRFQESMTKAIEKAQGKS